MSIQMITCPQCGSTEIKMLTESRGICERCGVQFLAFPDRNDFRGEPDPPSDPMVTEWEIPASEQEEDLPAQIFYDIFFHDNDIRISTASFEEAVDAVVEHGGCSTSLLQRKFRMGYASAARLVDYLEARGIVGPFRGPLDRSVLLEKEDWEKAKQLYREKAPLEKILQTIDVAFSEPVFRDFRFYLETDTASIEYNASIGYENEDGSFHRQPFSDRKNGVEATTILSLENCNSEVVSLFWEKFSELLPSALKAKAEPQPRSAVLSEGQYRQFLSEQQAEFHSVLYDLLPGDKADHLRWHFAEKPVPITQRLLVAPGCRMTIRFGRAVLHVFVFLFGSLTPIIEEMEVAEAKPLPPNEPSAEAAPSEPLPPDEPSAEAAPSDPLPSNEPSAEAAPPEASSKRKRSGFFSRLFGSH